MRKAGPRAAGLWQGCRREIFCRNFRTCGLLTSLAIFFLFSGAVPCAGASESRTVPQAQVNPQVIRLPLIDGNDLRFTRLSTAEGLSQSRVAQIAQDDQGFMWFGTQYGLNRYDGYNFRLFAHDPRNPKSFSCVYISALFKDRNGRLWVGCEQFLEKFEPETENFTRYPIRGVGHISQDSGGVLWLATGTGLYSLDPATGRIRQYSRDPKDPASLSSNEVKSAGEDREGRFWVVSSEGVDEFDRKTGKVMLHIPLHVGLPEFSFYEDRFGVFWIIYPSGNGLSVFDRKRNTLTRYSFYEREQPGNGLSGVMAVLEDRNGTLWFGTRVAGLLKFDREHQRFIRYRNNPADPESLPENYILSLCQDREGGIWAGLQSLGLTRFATKSTPFTPLLPNPVSLRTTKQVNALYEDHQGILWLATFDALHRIDRKAPSYRTSGPDAVITIREDTSDHLWLGTFTKGLHRLDRRTGHIKTYQHNPADPYSLSSNVVSRLLLDRNGTLWAATFDGLNRFDPATERFTTYTLDPQRKKLYYLELTEDRKGKLWLGSHYSGVHGFDPATGQFTVFEHDLNRLGTLSDNRVNSIHFDRHDTMWVGTQNGLNKLDPKTNAFTVYTQRDGLPGNAVSCILEDDAGSLWMSTNNGLAKFNPQTNSVVSYSTADGLPGLDLTGWGTCFKSSSGEMFFGGFGGAVAFFPAKVIRTPYTPTVVLTDFRLRGNPVTIGNQSPLHRSISYTESLILAHDQNTFSLTLSALSYSNSAANRYRFKLDALDHDWNEVGSDRRQATYTALPPGTYTFRAQGATSSGAWSQPSLALRIEILPPWYQTRAFEAACGLALSAAIWALYRFRVGQLEQEFKVASEARVQERTRIARELHDTLLQSVQASLVRMEVARTLASRQPEQAVGMLDQVISMTEGVIAESREAIQDLRTQPSVQDNLLTLLTLAGKELAGSQDGPGKTAAFRVRVEGERAYALQALAGKQNLKPLIQDEAYRIARELLRNAFQHAQASEIEAEIRYESHAFRLWVRDDGKGIDPQFLKAGSHAGHWGLIGMRERAKGIGGQLQIWSQPGAGTEVELTIPGTIAYESAREGRRRFTLFSRERA